MVQNAKKILMKLEYSQQPFEKHSYTKFHENLPSRSRVVTCRQTDVQTQLTNTSIMATLHNLEICREKQLADIIEVVPSESIATRGPHITRGPIIALTCIRALAFSYSLQECIFAESDISKVS
jgi:hypothetical protein